MWSFKINVYLHDIFYTLSPRLKNIIKSLPSRIRHHNGFTESILDIICFNICVELKSKSITLTSSDSWVRVELVVLSLSHITVFRKNSSKIEYFCELRYESFFIGDVAKNVFFGTLFSSKANSGRCEMRINSLGCLSILLMLDAFL